MCVQLEEEMHREGGISLSDAKGELSRYGRHDARETTGGRENPSGQAAGAVGEP